jgi:hypothetical protein
MSYYYGYYVNDLIYFILHYYQLPAVINSLNLTHLYLVNHLHYIFYHDKIYHYDLFQLTHINYYLRYG